MHKLPPASLYRLCTLAASGPRFYKISAYTRRLEVLEMIVATGRTDPETRCVEFRITSAGYAELAERYDELPSQDPQ